MDEVATRSSGKYWVYARLVRADGSEEDYGIIAEGVRDGGGNGENERREGPLDGTALGTGGPRDPELYGGGLGHDDADER
jgi:hypothetical protein